MTTFLRKLKSCNWY